MSHNRIQQSAKIDQKHVRPYCGRFAPTPSGPLHMGSLLTALAGFLQARQAKGQWRLRMDDLDIERSRNEHASTIQRQLEAHRLLWDGPVRWQSGHVEQYESAFKRIGQLATTYICTCTRAMLAEASPLGPDGPVYPGRCRPPQASSERGAIRLCVGEGRLQLFDAWQGLIERDLAQDMGDFILRRADGQIGYQLACVVDELALGITEVVRGADLIGSSLRQTFLFRLLDAGVPGYRHLPVLLEPSGRKLSKQNHSAPIDAASAGRNLHRCLELLGQAPPVVLAQDSAEAVMAWAVAHWNSVRVPRRPSLSFVH